MTRPISRRRHARRLARRPAGLVLAAAVLAASAAALSARTETFLETNQAQFDKGEFKGLVATNLGRLRLGRALDNLLARLHGHGGFHSDIVGAHDRNRLHKRGSGDFLFGTACYRQV